MQSPRSYSRDRKDLLVGGIQLAAIAVGSVVVLSLPNSLFIPTILILIVVLGVGVCRGT